MFIYVIFAHLFCGRDVARIIHQACVGFPLKPYAAAFIEKMLSLTCGMPCRCCNALDASYVSLTNNNLVIAVVIMWVIITYLLKVLVKSSIKLCISVH